MALEQQCDVSFEGKMVSKEDNLLIYYAKIQEFAYFHDRTVNKNKMMAYNKAFVTDIFCLMYKENMLFDLTLLNLRDSKTLEKEKMTKIVTMPF